MGPDWEFSFYRWENQGRKRLLETANQCRLLSRALKMYNARALFPASPTVAGDCWIGVKVHYLLINIICLPLNFSGACHSLWSHFISIILFQPYLNLKRYSFIITVLQMKWEILTGEVACPSSHGQYKTFCLWSLVTIFLFFSFNADSNKGFFIPFPNREIIEDSLTSTSATQGNGTPGQKSDTLPLGTQVMYSLSYWSVN
jgi:hypothetical protein